MTPREIAKDEAELKAELLTVYQQIDSLQEVRKKIEASLQYLGLKRQQTKPAEPEAKDRPVKAEPRKGK